MADVGEMLDKLATPELNPIVAPIERVFDSMGMMKGSMAPVLRGATGFALGTGIVYAVRPALMFTSNGTPRPWNYIRNQPGVSTPVPWWLPGTALAIFFSVFV